MLLGLFLWVALPRLVALCLPHPPSRYSHLKALQRPSESIHDASCAHVWYQGGRSTSVFSVKMCVSHVSFTRSFSATNGGEWSYHFSVNLCFLHSYQLLLLMLFSCTSCSDSIIANTSIAIRVVLLNYFKLNLNAAKVAERISQVWRNQTIFDRTAQY